MLERLVVGFGICLGMITLSGWIGSDSASKDDIHTAIEVLKKDAEENNRNVMNISNSLLQRLRRIEDRMNITPPERYQITVNDKKI